MFTTTMKIYFASKAGIMVYKAVKRKLNNKVVVVKKMAREV